MNRVSLSSLPSDVLKTLSSFLSGFDVFHLSHTNSFALRAMSDNPFWDYRVLRGGVGNLLPRGTWKQRYMQARSLQFLNQRRPRGTGHRTAFAMLERPELPVFWSGGRFQLRNDNHNSFSLDVWFCLLPSNSHQPAGGVIYGLQTISVCDSQSRVGSGLFVLVDAQRKLFASVMNETQAVATDLETKCWYHLALTYDVQLQRQDVYIDGVNVWWTMGALNYKWQRFHHEQIGTGFCGNSFDTEGVHFPPFRRGVDWYTFNGLIDEFRVWRSALSADAVAELAGGGQPSDLTVLATIKPSHGHRNSWIRTKSVRCTRPAEGKCVVFEEKRL